MSAQTEFLDRLRARLADAAPTSRTHPMPTRPPTAPVVVSRRLDPTDLLDSFVSAARAALATVHVVDSPSIPMELLADIVARHGVATAVIGAEPSLVALPGALSKLGVRCDPLDVERAAAADMGITTAVYGIATTGTFVQDSSVTGGRTASLLPPLHLCLLPRSAIVASTAEVLRPLSLRTVMPSNLVLINGPSRSADIEQTMTRGIHGPTAVEIVVHCDPVSPGDQLT